MWRVIRFGFTLSIMLSYGCCGNSGVGRDWEVTGRVLDADTSEPIPGAVVEVVVRFSIEGGQYRLGPVTTDAQGRFTATKRFNASCLRVAIFESEAEATDGRFHPVLQLSTRTGDAVTHRGFGGPNLEDYTVAFSKIAGFGVEMTVELSPVFVSSSP